MSEMTDADFIAAMRLLTQTMEQFNTDFIGALEIVHPDLKDES